MRRVSTLTDVGRLTTTHVPQLFTRSGQSEIIFLKNNLKRWRRKRDDARWSSFETSSRWKLLFLGKSIWCPTREFFLFTHTHNMRRWMMPPNKKIIELQQCSSLVYNHHHHHQTSWTLCTQYMMLTRHGDDEWEWWYYERTYHSHFLKRLGPRNPSTWSWHGRDDEEGEEMAAEENMWSTLRSLLIEK